jgi:hypothetical protein
MTEPTPLYRLFGLSWIDSFRGTAIGPRQDAPVLAHEKRIASAPPAFPTLFQDSFHLVPSRTLQGRVGEMERNESSEL